ncbi:MAG: dihydroneopterin aldolase [candidate division Zixibacteria bacterium]|nr:dihydroneopterin aldolase [candidate division Zixibacteria bacterium]
MKDVIRLVGLTFYGYHGVSAAERETGRQFEVDCELETDLAAAGHSDALKDTIDYAKAYDLIRVTVEGEAYSLLEGLANRLAALLLDRFAVYRVTLKVRKLHPPVGGQVKHIEIEVTRYQGDIGKLTDSPVRKD